MFEKTKTSTKNFVVKHKAKIAFVSAAVICTAVNQIALKQHNEFLKEHGLYEQFYNPEAAAGL